jgi:hypothetical protein
LIASIVSGYITLACILVGSSRLPVVRGRVNADGRADDTTSRLAESTAAVGKS